MNRRKFLKLAILSTTATAFVPHPANALGLPWGNNHLDELTFSRLFPKPIYQKSYFSAIAMVTAMVVAGVVSYFTAGAGAPASALGVSTIASWIAGGGAGSYMARLSTIGGWFGGNAMLGEASLFL